MSVIETPHQHPSSQRQGRSVSHIDDQSIISKFHRVYDYLRRNNKENEYKERVDDLQQEALRIMRLTASTHSKLITNWSCKHDGNEFARKGGGLGLSVNITLMRAIVAPNVDVLIDFILDAVKAGVRPQEIKLSIE